MKDDTKQSRMIEIEAKAYDLVAERGYASVSMLMIAKAAKASNETLYRWYGDKKGMFRVMVDRNTARVTDILVNRTGEGDPMKELRALAPRLLGMVVGDRAIALNRAAASDPTGELGAAIAAGGRDTVGPHIAAILQRAADAGQLHIPSSALASEWFIRLLIGDLQNRRVIGVVEKPTHDMIANRSDEACEMILRLCAPKTQ